MKVTVLGAGAYGIALSLMLNENNCDITLWENFEENANILRDTRENKKVLPGVIIPDNIKITSDLALSVENSELIIIAIPAGFVDDVSSKLKKYVKKNQHICIASKGIEQDTCLFVDDVVLKNINTKKISVISGPSFAIDIARKAPIGLTIASKNNKTIDIVEKALQNETLKLRKINDIIGTEICGSIKNVIAIASGIIDGMGLPESTQAMFITESLLDIGELIKALGGNKKTILTFAGFGDLLLTCTSTKSRNFTFGKMIGENQSKEKVNYYIKNTTIEGLYTLKSIYKLLKNKKVNIPIIDLIYDIVFNNCDPNEIKKFLISKK